MTGHAGKELAELCSAWTGEGARPHTIKVPSRSRGFPRARRVESHIPTMTDPSQRKLIIAIDGPAGAGKSTIASRLARRLGYVNLESGAMYRALALKAIERDVSFEDDPALVKLAHNSRILLEPGMSGNRVLLDSRDVSQRVREPDVTEAASRVSV